nr:AAA family ATPase [bacterium]
IIEEKEEKIKISGLKEIIKENSPSKKRRQTLQEVFKHFKEKGQIEFITFHQSYSYEDFVEGIKPIPPKEDENQSEEMVFRTQPGVFKRICDEAIIENFLEDYSGKKFYRIALGRKNENPTERLKYCYEKNLIGLGYIGYKKDLSNYKNEKEIKENANVDPTGYKMLNYLVNGMKNGDIVFVTEGQNIVAICEINGNYSFSENPDEIMIGYEHQRAVKWIKKDINLSVKKLFSYKTVPGNSLSPIIFEKKDVVSNFVLIIDEINRGNISKIFGELITLIEDDKRLGEENEMTVTLPYSKDSFGVPTNLHIVGTMNTADRSIALMDMALRRRFSFQEMMPRYDVLEGIKVEKDGKEIIISELLKKINERIEFLYDRDHTIGHAYFIKLKNNPDYKELCSIFANKIIPLLQEYFYEDWEKIQIVLGDHIKQYKKEEKDECKEWDDEINKTRFIQSKISVETDVIGFNHNDFENSTVYRINPKLIENDMPEESFRKISEPAKKSAEEQDSKTKQ